MSVLHSFFFSLKSHYLIAILSASSLIALSLCLYWTNWRFTALCASHLLLCGLLSPPTVHYNTLRSTNQWNCYGWFHGRCQIPEDTRQFYSVLGLCRRRLFNIREAVSWSPLRRSGAHKPGDVPHHASRSHVTVNNFTRRWTLQYWLDPDIHSTFFYHLLP